MTMYDDTVNIQTVIDACVKNVIAYCNTHHINKQYPPTHQMSDYEVYELIRKANVRELAWIYNSPKDAYRMLKYAEGHCIECYLTKHHFECEDDALHWTLCFGLLGEDALVMLVKLYLEEEFEEDE